jgi:hypothetical protein
MAMIVIKIMNEVSSYNVLAQITRKISLNAMKGQLYFNALKGQLNGIPFPFRQLTCKFDEDCHDQASTFVEILKLHGKLLICEEGIFRAISF